MRILVPRFPQLRNARPAYREPRRGDVRFSQADICKAMRLLGYQPPYRVKQGLERAIDWYVAHLAPAQTQRRVAHA